MVKIYDWAKRNQKVGAGKMAAAVFRNGDSNPISIGLNSLKTHPLQAKFANSPHRIYLHAETEAISRAVRLLGDDLEGCSLYVARSKQPDCPVRGIAKPCSGCISCASHFGIDVIYYTLDKDEAIGEIALNG